MGNKKMGRPTDNPKTISFKIRLDQEIDRTLEQCAKTANVSKAEILRRGIHMIYNDLKKA